MYKGFKCVQSANDTLTALLLENEILMPGLSADGAG